MSDFLIRGINDVTTERLRQINEEGYSASRDDSYQGGELAAAGASYAIHAAWHVNTRSPEGSLPGVPEWYPWDGATWNPKDVRTNLVKAAALIIAEIDRFDRKAAEAANTSSEDIGQESEK